MKKNKKKNEFNLDNELNSVIRELCLNSCMQSLCTLKSRFGKEVIEKTIEAMKIVYYNIDVSDLLPCKPIYYINILDYILELSILGERMEPQEIIKRKINNIKSKFVDILRNDDVKSDLLAFTMLVGNRFGNRKLYQDNSNSELELVYNFQGEVIKAVTGICTLFAEYITTYTAKFKNQVISIFKEEDSHVVIKYTKEQLLTIEQIKKLKSGLRESDHFDKKFDEYSYKITENFTKGCYNHLADTVPNTLKSRYYGYIHVSENFKNIPIPFFEGEKFMLSPEQVNKVPHQRKYASYAEGIIFNFKDKSFIDNIEMKEDKYSINFKVNVTNNNHLYTASKDEESDCENIMMDKRAYNFAVEKHPIEDKIISLVFKVEKEKLYEATTPIEKISSISRINFANATDRQSKDFVFYLYYITYACIYMAYCDPLAFKKQVELSSIHDSRRKTPGYTHSTGYKVAYIRRLPKGQKMSPDAKRNAKAEGFDFIPDGFTFVRASYPVDKQIKEKVIEIDNSRQ